MLYLDGVKKNSLKEGKRKKVKYLYSFEEIEDLLFGRKRREIKIKYIKL